MSPARRGLLALSKRYPEYTDVMERIYGNDEEFRILCEDYQVCFEALQYWNRTDSEEAPKRRQEYASLAKELEEEIQLFIKESEAIN